MLKSVKIWAEGEAVKIGFLKKQRLAKKNIVVATYDLFSSSSAAVVVVVVVVALAPPFVEVKMILKKFSSSSSQQDVSLGGLDKSKAPETSAATTITSTTTGLTT